MILTSWKEIASHLNCAVRTAQRWEQHGLPVRRPIPGRRGYVTADAELLDSWLRDSAFWRLNDFVRLGEVQRSRALRAEAGHSRDLLRKNMASLRREAELLQHGVRLMQTRFSPTQNPAVVRPGRVDQPTLVRGVTFRRGASLFSL